MSKANPLVRVKDPSTGDEYNASRIYAERAGLKVLDKATHDAYGRPVLLKSDPLKADEKSTAKKTAAKAADTQES